MTIIYKESRGSLIPNWCRIIEKLPDRVKRPRLQLPRHLGIKHLTFSWFLISILIKLYIFMANSESCLQFLTVWLIYLISVQCHMPKLILSVFSFYFIDKTHVGTPQYFTLSNPWYCTLGDRFLPCKASSGHFLYCTKCYCSSAITYLALLILCITVALYFVLSVWRSQRLCWPLSISVVY